MNHFDDRASYIAFLRDQNRLIQILDNNQKQDYSLCTFGAGRVGGTVPMITDFKQDI
jgi:hypothetical protein